MKTNRKRQAEIRRNRIIFTIVVLLVLGGAAWGIWYFTKSDEEAPPPPSTSSESDSQITSSSSSSQSDISSQSSSSQSSSQSDSSGQSSSQPEVIDYTTSWNLLLVNKTYTLGAEHTVELGTVGGYSVDKRIVDPLNQMLKDAKAAGHSLTVISAHRSFARSKLLYENKTAEYVGLGYNKQDAAVEAAKWVAPPGTSEHNTGLAVDIVSADYFTKLPDLLPEFETFPEAIWMKEHCAEYGFILRFPKGKEDITTVNYEPWHFRYVGTEAAKKIMADGLTLEEYLGKA